MPKTKTSTGSIADLKTTRIGKSFAGKVKDKLYQLGKNMEYVALIMGVSMSTAYVRFQHPDEFTVKEIMRIGTQLKFTDEDYIKIFELKGSTK